MSEKDAEYDAYQAALAQERADAAREWDELDASPLESIRGEESFYLGGVAHPVLPEGYDVLGDAVAEYLEAMPIGPIEFEGKEDYIRGDDGHDYVRGETACLRGCDIVGAVAQFGSKRGRKLKVQSQGAGFVRRTLPGGKSFLAVKVRPTATHQGSIDKARMVARNAKAIASSLLNFKTVPAAHRRVVGVDWAELVGVLEPGFDEIVGDDDVRSTFDDILGPPRRRPRLPSDATVRALARALSKQADVLNRTADRHESGVAKGVASAQRGIDASRQRLFSGGAHVAGWTRDLLGDALGEESFFLGDDVQNYWSQPDPDHPGQLMDGTPDPNYTGNAAAPASAPTDGSASTDTSSADASAGYPGIPPGPPDYGIGPAPTTTPARDDYFMTDPGPSTDRTIYDTSRMPLAGIIYYEGERGFPRDKLGSFNRYYGPGAGSPNGGSGFYWSDSGDGWVGRIKRDETGSDYEDGHNVSVDTLLEGTGHPFNNRFGQLMDVGPLVGAPGDWTEGLRFDMATRSWFWFWDAAPSWATGKVVENANLMLKAQTDYQAALTQAKSDYLQAVAIAKQNAAAAKAQADAWALEQTKIQHDKERADAAAAVTQAQTDAQAAAAEQQFTQQMAQQGLQQQAQQQQIDYQQQQAETSAYADWLKNPQPLQPVDQSVDNGPFDDLYQQPAEDQFGEPQLDQSEMDLSASASQRPDDGDWG